MGFKTAIEECKLLHEKKNFELLIPSPILVFLLLTLNMYMESPPREMGGGEGGGEGAILSGLGGA